MAGNRRMKAVKKFLHPRTVAGIRMGELVHRREDCLMIRIASRSRSSRGRLAIIEENVATRLLQI